VLAPGLGVTWIAIFHMVTLKWSADDSRTCGCTLQVLILHLLCERAKGPASFWAPYIDMLPKQVCTYQDMCTYVHVCKSARSCRHARLHLCKVNY